MHHFHWSHKVHDFYAAAVGGGVLAAFNLVDVTAWVQLLVLLFTLIFLGLGICMRAERFVRRMSRAFYGLPIDPTEEQKRDAEEKEDED